MLDGDHKATIIAIIGALIGGLAAWAQRESIHNQPFSWWRLVAALLSAFAVGVISNSFIGADVEYRTGIISLLGAVSYQIFGWLSTRKTDEVMSFILAVIRRGK